MGKTNELDKFIRTTLEQIKESLGDDYAIEGAVDFELSVGVTKSAGGGLNIQILEMDGSVNHEVVQTVNVSIVDKKNPEFRANHIIQEKIANWLDQPNQKILEDLNKLTQSNKKEPIQITKD